MNEALFRISLIFPYSIYLHSNLAEFYTSVNYMFIGSSYTHTKKKKINTRG
uniref:Uncharacterized protein n=1 Tax=Anguilla anguilla TaxID=7936 RepID=A0A0E9R7F4_ANGAN